MENGEKLLVTGSDGLHPYLQHAAQAEAMGRRGDLLLATLSLVGSEACTALYCCGPPSPQQFQKLAGLRLYSWCLAGLPDRSFSLPCKKGTENQVWARIVW